jgi:hypothetical protein
MAQTATSQKYCSDSRMLFLELSEGVVLGAGASELAAKLPQTGPFRLEASQSERYSRGLARIVGRVRKCRLLGLAGYNKPFLKLALSMSGSSQVLSNTHRGKKRSDR